MPGHCLRRGAVRTGAAGCGSLLLLQYNQNRYNQASILKHFLLGPASALGIGAGSRVVEMDESKMGDEKHVPSHQQLTQRDGKPAKYVEIRPPEIVSKTAAKRGIPVASASSWHLPPRVSLAFEG